jgi:hypothetical protein
MRQQRSGLECVGFPPVARLPMAKLIKKMTEILAEYMIAGDAENRRNC